MRTLALGCAADLMKADAAVQAAASSPDFLPTVLDALQARSLCFTLGPPARCARCRQAYQVYLGRLHTVLDALQGTCWHEHDRMFGSPHAMQGRQASSLR